MATLPYIQLYVSDYLADTQHLTTEEHGAYLLLIMNYWQTEKPIPENRLQGITRMFNDRWASVQQNLSEFFKTDDSGSWYHERIYQDLVKVKAKSKQASEAGKKSAQARAKKKPKNTELNNDSSTTVKQKSSDRSTIEEEREKKKEKREKSTESNIVKAKPFTFTLDKQRLLSSTSKEYKSKLKDYIDNSGKNMSYEDFYEKCEMKPYKYKNFQMAYSSWNKGDTKQRSSLGKSFEQMRKEEISNTVDVVLGSGVNPFNPDNYEQEEIIDVVQITG